MKKLMMIAAAMTIASGAFGQCGDPEEPDYNCALVYKVKMSLKTTVAKSATTSYDCADDELICYREKGKVNLMGYAYSCACSCLDFMDASVLLWDKKTKEYYIDDESIGWLFVNIIGKKAKKVEGAFEIDGAYVSLLGAGQGTFDDKNMIVKKISGNVAGYGFGPLCTGVDCADYYSGAFICDDYMSDEWSDQVPTAYFGTFSFSYSKNDSKKQASDGNYVYDKAPDYFSF